MIRLAFAVAGPPVPKARARVYQKVLGRGATETRAVTPQKTKDYEKRVGMVALAARLQANGWRLDALYGLTVRVYRSERRGDWDNFMKAVSDACNGVLWNDDRQIVRWGEGGIWNVPEGQERVEVEAWIVE